MRVGLPRSTMITSRSNRLPEKLAELQRPFLIEAAPYNVLPLDDRRVERFNSDLAGRPVLIRGKSQLMLGGMGRLSENNVITTKNKSHAVTAETDLSDTDATGVLVAQGGAFGGWVLYMLEDRPVHCYNLFGAQRFEIHGDRQVGPAEHQIRAEFDYDGGGLGKGELVTLYVDGNEVGEGRVEATQPMIFSADETNDVGNDTATSVTDDLGPGEARFDGDIRWVQIDIGEDAEDSDHPISDEERLRDRHDAAVTPQRDSGLRSPAG